MISPLTQTFAPMPPSPRARDKNSGNDDFRNLLNADRANEKSSSVPNVGNSDSPATDEPTDNGAALSDLLVANPASPIVVPTVSPNGLEAQVQIPSQPSGQPAAPIASPPVAPTMTEGDRLTLPEAAVRVNAGAPGENVELVAMPWHLKANGGLSYRVIGAKAQDVPANQTSHADAEILSNLSMRNTAVATIEETGFAETQTAVLHGGALNFVSDRVQRSAAMSVAADVAMPGRTTSALLLWPHRLLRWLADGDAGLTAWVRDYRLDATQAGQLIYSLRCLADQQGYSLHRIMLNGHELWRAPSTPDSN